MNITQTRSRHPLQEWCFFNRVSLASVARDLNVTRGMLDHWLTGRRRIFSDVAFQIQEMTDGAVAIDDWAWVYFPADGTEVRHSEAPVPADQGAP